jgi:hypothetical protein
MARQKEPSSTQAPAPAETSATAEALKQTLPRSNKTLTVACKMPHGVVIRDFQKKTEFEPVFGQAEKRKVDVYRPIGPKIRIKGPMVPNVFIRAIEVIGGYAITEGVPADVYERWAEANKESPFIVNQLIYAHENGARVRDWAKDHTAVKSGMEPLEVSMKMTPDGRQVFTDERVTRAGADQVVDGKADPKAA